MARAGALLPAPCSCAGRPRTAGFQGPQCKWASAQIALCCLRSTVCMCKVTQTTVLTLFWQLELFMLKETLLSVTAVILVLKIKLMYAKNSLDGYFELLEMFL